MVKMYLYVQRVVKDVKLKIRTYNRGKQTQKGMVMWELGYLKECLLTSLIYKKRETE